MAVLDQASFNILTDGGFAAARNHLDYLRRIRNKRIEEAKTWVTGNATGYVTIAEQVFTGTGEPYEIAGLHAGVKVLDMGSLIAGQYNANPTEATLDARWRQAFIIVEHLYPDTLETSGNLLATVKHLAPFLHQLTGTELLYARISDKDTIPSKKDLEVLNAEAMFGIKI